jgi:hypothetical protein
LTPGSCFDGGFAARLISLAVGAIALSKKRWAAAQAERNRIRVQMSAAGALASVIAVYKGKTSTIFSGLFVVGCD